MVAMAATAATERIRPRPTHSRGVAAAAAVAAADPAAARGHAGRQPVLPWHIRLPRCGRSRLSATTSRSGRPCPWDDRKGPAKELHDLLESRRVSVWFSEKDVTLGSSLLREIDKGLARSRVGIVLVTPALLRRVQAEGIADKELSALLARDLLVPIVHGTTYEALREVSPLLGSRSGLSTAEEPMANIAAKLAELVAP